MSGCKVGDSKIPHVSLDGTFLRRALTLGRVWAVPNDSDVNDESIHVAKTVFPSSRPLEYWILSAWQWQEFIDFFSRFL